MSLKRVSLPQIERDSANCVAGHDIKRFKSRRVAFRKRDPDRVGKDSAIVVAWLTVKLHVLLDFQGPDTWSAALCTRQAYL